MYICSNRRYEELLLQYITLDTILVKNDRHFSHFRIVRSMRKTQRKGVLRFDLNTCEVFDDVTSDDRLLHVFGAATGKARSQIMQSPRAVVMIQPLLRWKMNAVVADRGFGHVENKVIYI